MASPKTTEPMRDDILEFVRKSEETITEASRKWGETLCDLVPGEGANLRKIVDDAFDFTDTVLKNQREFAHSVLDRLLGPTTPKRASTRGPAKAAAKRTPPRTAAKAGAA